MIKPGDKVKYIGSGVSKYTGQMLEVKSVLRSGVILWFPEEDRGRVILEGGGNWGTVSLMCGYSEVEENESL